MKLLGLCAAALGGVACGDVWPLGASVIAWAIVGLAAGLLGALLAAALSGHLTRSRAVWLSLALLCAAALGFGRASLAAPPERAPPASPARSAASAAGAADGFAGARASAVAVDGFAGARAAAAAGLRAYLPPPEAGLAVGVLLGGSRELDPATRENLQRAGLGHLLAIDGYKLVVVTAALSAVLVRLVGPRLATPPLWLALGGYTLLTGAHPSAVRAALMIGLATTAALIGRVADPLTSLALATVLMAAVEPGVLLEVGLQLSLSATLGLILLWPRLRRRLRPGRGAYPWWRAVQPWLAQPAGLTLAVTIASLPVLLSVFQTISLVSPLAHILVVPLLPPVLLASAVLALAAPLPALAVPLAWLAWAPTTLLLRIATLCGSLPNAAISTGRLPPLAALGLAGALLGWGVWGLPELRHVRVRLGRALRRHTRGRRRPWPLVAGLSLLMVGALARMVAPADLRQDRVLALDGADAAAALLVRAPGGRTALVVRGRFDARRVASRLAAELPVWQHKLDLVVALDAAAEPRLAPVLARYPADVWLSAAALRQAGPLLQPDQDEQVQHDHDEHDDQLHAFTDDHG